MPDFDVVVVGCGPVGALTANLLGQRGITTLVIERSLEPHGQPRAFSCDDEALRIYQQAGLADAVGADMYAAPLVQYVDANGRPFAEIALSEVDFGLGHPPLQFFDQPRLEAALRTGLRRFEPVELRLGTELVELTQDGDGVTLRTRDATTGVECLVRARYVLGCDGAHSTTRRLVGIDLAGATFDEPWLAVSGQVPPDAIRVPTTRFVCDWRRPAFVSPGTHGSYRLEFMLRPGETAAEMGRPEVIARLVEPYLDPARFDVTRAVVYTFHRLVAKDWRAGRVFLLGDAAHQMPPFMGQGLCSGLRDAANLTWKLGLVLAGHAGPTLLGTYEAERRPHTEEMATVTVQVGRIFLARRRSIAWLRDAALRTIQQVPRVRRFFRHFEFKPRPIHPSGLTASGRSTHVEGHMFPQPRVGTAGSARPRPLDDVLGADFTVVGPGVNPEMATDPAWLGLPVAFVGVHPQGTVAVGSGNATYREVVDVDGVLADWYRRHGVDVAVLRPDRFVFGAVKGTAGVLARTLAEALRPSPVRISS